MMQTVENIMPLGFTLNGERQELEVPTNITVSALLRDQLELTGGNVSCERAVCGACTVLVDGRPTAACATFAFELDGADVRTIEGLEAADGSLDPVQEAFADLSAFQCGYCTPGMIMLARALLDRDPDPSDATITRWISSNICRCTGYAMIVEAVKDAAHRQREAG